jgi:hypothetical protein
MVEVLSQLGLLDKAFYAIEYANEHPDELTAKLSESVSYAFEDGWYHITLD